MQEYLYIINYPPYEKELCQLEFQCLFGRNLKTKYFISSQDIDFYRSPFIRSRIDILIKSKDYNDLVDYVNTHSLFYYDFKVVYVKNETTHVPYQQSLDYCKELALPIDGTIDMHHPKTIIALTKIDDLWILGIQKVNDQWDQNASKPYTFSSSLPIRIARSMVNIGVGQDVSLKVVDPCCGVGTVVLEALAMGIDCKGYDISRDVAYEARLNLQYFGYDPYLIEKKDIKDIDEHFDVGLLDIPYGINSMTTEQSQDAIIKASYKLCDKLVLVSLKDMSASAKAAGYKLISQCKVGKNDFMDRTRYITVWIKEEK